MASDNPQSLMRLLAWLSPAFPIGAFAYSAGLEKAVEDGRVKTGDDLFDWIALVIEQGSLWNDALLLVGASKAFRDGQALSELSELGLALAGSRERYSETLALGRAFKDAASAWPNEYAALLPNDLPYPVAIGAIAGASGVSAQSALIGFLHAAASQAISAGIRLSVIGQSKGTAILAGLEPHIARIAEIAIASTLDDLGSATIGAEISSLRHEEQKVRLFRS